MSGACACQCCASAPCYAPDWHLCHHPGKYNNKARTCGCGQHDAIRLNPGNEAPLLVALYVGQECVGPSVNDHLVEYLVHLFWFSATTPKKLALEAHTQRYHYTCAQPPRQKHLSKTVCTCITHHVAPQWLGAAVGFETGVFMQQTPGGPGIRSFLHIGSPMEFSPESSSFMVHVARLAAP